MYDVTPRERERVSMWLDVEITDQIDRLADSETEGNVSLMIRKLLREALAARSQEANA